MSICFGNRVATLVNLSPDSRNLANFKAFGHKYFDFAIWQISSDFLKAFGSKFCGLA